MCTDWGGSHQATQEMSVQSILSLLMWSQLNIIMWLARCYSMAILHNWQILCCSMQLCSTLCWVALSFVYAIGKFYLPKNKFVPVVMVGLIGCHNWFVLPVCGCWTSLSTSLVTPNVSGNHFKPFWLTKIFTYLFAYGSWRSAIKLSAKGDASPR